MQVNRRAWLIAAAATMAATGAEGATMAYDYLFFDLSPGEAPGRALTRRLAAEGTALARDGGAVLGQWTPQLGWTSRQGAVLIGWTGESGGREAAMARLAAAPEGQLIRRDRLTPTARPAPGARPPPGGIYVHRWFVIGRDDVDAFVALSVEGWRDFEVRFDTRIFGLFTAAPTPDDDAKGVVRLLLITRYGSHQVWEDSRNPSTDAWAAFTRRQQLTRDTWGASTLLVAPT
jgi:hypothetical protein